MANFTWRQVLESHGYIKRLVDEDTPTKDILSNIYEIRQIIEKYGVNSVDRNGFMIYDCFWTMDYLLIDLITSMGLDLRRGEDNLFWPGWYDRGVTILGIILKHDVNYVYVKHRCEMFVDSRLNLYDDIISYVEDIIKWCIKREDRVGESGLDLAYIVHVMLMDHRNKEYKEKTFFSWMYDKLKDSILTVNTNKIHIK